MDQNELARRMGVYLTGCSTHSDKSRMHLKEGGAAKTRAERGSHRMGENGAGILSKEAAEFHKNRKHYDQNGRQLDANGGRAKKGISDSHAGMTYDRGWKYPDGSRPDGKRIDRAEGGPASKSVLNNSPEMQERRKRYNAEKSPTTATAASRKNALLAASKRGEMRHMGVETGGRKKAYIGGSMAEPRKPNSHKMDFSKVHHIDRVDRKDFSAENKKNYESGAIRHMGNFGEGRKKKASGGRTWAESLKPDPRRAAEGGTMKGWGERAKSDAEKTGNKIKSTAEDTGRTIRSGAEDVGNRIKGTAEDTGRKIKSGAEDVGNKIKSGSEDVGNKIKNFFHFAEGGAAVEDLEGGSNKTVRHSMKLKSGNRLMSRKKADGGDVTIARKPTRTMSKEDREVASRDRKPTRTVKRGEFLTKPTRSVPKGFNRLDRD